MTATKRLIDRLIEDSLSGELVVDDDPPFLAAEVPLPGTIEVVSAQLVSFLLDDTNAGVDPASVIITIQQGVSALVQTVYTGGTFQTGWSGSRVAGGVGGYTFSFQPASGHLVQYVAITVRVRAQDLAPVPNALDVSYTFVTKDEVLPYITLRSPPLGETSTPLGSPLSFTARDDLSGVVPTTLSATVTQGANPSVPAVVAGVIQPAFAGPGSGITTSDGLNYAVVLAPLSQLVGNTTISVAWSFADRSANLATGAWSFDTVPPVAPPAPILPQPLTLTSGAPFPLDMYRFLILEIRRQDMLYGGQFLKRWFQGPNIMWQTTVARILALPTLWDVLACPDAQLQHLKAIVGWTKEPFFARISSTLDAKTLRRLIAASGDLWNKRGPEDSILDILRILTAQRARIWNWFDFRWIVGETALSEDHEGTDPWLIDEAFAPHDSAYRSHLRIMDDGTVNRALVKQVLYIMRAVNERYDISYLLLLDTFDVDGDDLQWDHSSPSTAQVVAGGMMQLDRAVAQSTFTIVPGASGWSSYCVSARIRGRNTAGGQRFGLIFYRVDASNYYVVVADTTSHTLKLQKVVAGVVTDLASVDLTTTVENILPSVWYLWRVAVVLEGSASRIQIYVDNSLMISALDSTFTHGSVGIMKDANATMELKETEVSRLPADVDSLEINAVP